MLTALAQAATDLGIGLVVACLMFGLAVLIGRCIHGPETPEFTPSDFGGPEDVTDLDDWLADMAVEFDFELWKRSTASTKERAA